MRCPVCGKHVAEERYEGHVGRHTDVGADADAAPAELESVPAAVGATTLEAPGASVDAGALLLGPEGSAMPLQEHDDAHDDDETSPTVVEDEAPAGADEPPVVEDEAPVEATAPLAVEDEAALVEDDAPVVEDDAPVVEDDAPVVEDDAPVVEDDAPVVEDEPVVTDEAPVDATAPLAVDAPAAWGAPPAAPFGGEAPATGRRSPLPILGLVALVIAAAIVVFVVTRDDGGTKKVARVKATATTTTPTFGAVAAPGSPGATSPTPTFPPSPSGYSPQAPPLAIPPPAPGVAPPPGASAPPASRSAAAGQIQVSPARAVCENDTMTVSGTVVNGGTSRYNVTFTVTVKNAQGATLGTARTTVSGLNPRERRTFEAQGTCSGELGDGNRADPTIESVTPA